MFLIFYEPANRVLTRFVWLNHLNAVHLNARRMRASGINVDRISLTVLACLLAPKENYETLCFRSVDGLVRAGNHSTRATAGQRNSSPAANSGRQRKGEGCPLETAAG